MKMILNEATKNFMLKVYSQYLENRLTYEEEVRMFQDLYDSGLYLQMGKEVINYVERLIKTELIIKSDNLKLN